MYVQGLCPLRGYNLKDCVDHFIQSDLRTLRPSDFQVVLIF